MILGHTQVLMKKLLIDKYMIPNISGVEYPECILKSDVIHYFKFFLPEGDAPFIFSDLIIIQ